MSAEHESSTSESDERRSVPRVDLGRVYSTTTPKMCTCHGMGVRVHSAFTSVREHSGKVAQSRAMRHCAPLLDCRPRQCALAAGR